MSISNDVTQSVELARAGDRDSFARLMEQFDGMITSVIRLRVDNESDLEDVRQQVLIHAWRDLPGLQDSSRFAYWLKSLARRCAQTFLRKRRRVEVSVEPQAWEQLAHRQSLPRHRRMELIETIHDALERIPRAQREIAEQFYLQGLSISEIAQLRALPEGTVKRLLMEARTAVRQKLELQPAQPRREQMMKRPASFDEALDRLRDELKAAGKSMYIPLVSKEMIVRGIEDSIKNYEPLNSQRGKPYFDGVIKPILRGIVDSNQWPEGVQFEYFFDDHRTNSTGFSMGLEIHTPSDGVYKMFSLEVVSVWYGRWMEDAVPSA